MERKLATVQHIDGLEPIEGADLIVRARVMGWDVVVKRGEFAVGDRCVFFEIDSLLPDGAPWAEFMRPRGFRIKTARLRGVLSQGLALPTSVLPEGIAVPEIGTDVSKVLGVQKYEPVLPDTREVAGPFPGEVPKTDEIRLQSALGVLDEIRGKPFVVTTKLDGTSTTFFKKSEDELVACSRNWALLRVETNAVWRVASELELAARLPIGFVVQGELCGPGIQKNRLGLSKVSFFAFNVYDTRAGRYLGHQEMASFCAERGIPAVPVEHLLVGDDAARFEHTLECYLELSKGFYPGTKNRKEGIVVRPLEEARSETLGGRLSFKIISNEFLLKDEE
jgi:RNA ligase (TIGR02306 family)